MRTLLNIKYDKDINARVFQLRDSERYTNSTQTFLEITEGTHYKNHFEATLTATVKKHTGTGSLAFYLDGELLDIEVCNQEVAEGETMSVSEISFTTDLDYGYHKIYAKYLGNAECLSSKSKIIELDVVNEADTNIILESANTANWFASTEFIDVGVTLVDVQNNQIQGKTLKVYIDDADEPVDFSYNGNSGNLGNLQDLVEYTDTQTIPIKIVFEEDEYYFGSEAEIELRIGYILKAEPVASSIGVGDTLKVNVTYTGLDGVPMASNPVTLNGMTRLTDSEGKATLYSRMDEEGTYTYEVEGLLGWTSEPFSINVVEIDRIELSASKMYVREGDITTITATCYSNHALVPNLLVTFGDDEYVTDIYGKLSFNYTGTGEGVRKITATAGDYSHGINIYDVYYYFSIANQIGDFDVVESAPLQWEIRKNGVYLYSTPNGWGGFGMHRKDNNSFNWFNEDWHFEFKIVSIWEGTSLHISGYEISYDMLKNKPTIVQEVINGTLRVYVGNQQVVNRDYPSEPMVRLSGGIIVDEIKCWKEAV